MPAGFPPHTAVEHYFYLWRDSGALQNVSRRVFELDRLAEGQEAMPSVLCIDSQSVKLAPRACEHRSKDAHKRVNGRKRHFLVDTFGRLWAALVTAANVHDSRGALPLIGELPLQRLKKVVADTGYKGRLSRAVEGAGIAFELGSRPESEQGFVPNQTPLGSRENHRLYQLLPRTAGRLYLQPALGRSLDVCDEYHSVP